MPGKGSYGSVYKGRDRLTSELVAIKVISLSEGVSEGEGVHVSLTQCSEGRHYSKRIIFP